MYYALKKDQKIRVKGITHPVTVIVPEADGCDRIVCIDHFNNYRLILAQDIISTVEDATRVPTLEKNRYSIWMTPRGSDPKVMDVWIVRGQQAFVGSNGSWSGVVRMVENQRGETDYRYSPFATDSTIVCNTIHMLSYAIMGFQENQ